MESLPRPNVNLTYPSEPVFLWSPILSLQDVALVLSLGVSIFVLRWILTKVVFDPITSALGIFKRQYREKVNENLWYCVYYPTVIAFGWKLLSPLPWFPWRPEHYWSTFPAFHDWFDYPAAYLYYMGQLSFYVQGSVALLWFETKRKDFYELLLHHVVTILLIVFSYCASEHRIGLNVLIIHDFSDVFLYGTKVLHYWDKFGKSPSWLVNVFTNISFFSFAVAFAVSRNFVFPVYVIVPSLAVAHNLVGYGTTLADAASYCPGQDCTHIAVHTLADQPHYIREGMRQLVASAPANAVSEAARSILSNVFTRLHYVYDGARVNTFELSHLGACIGGHCFHSGWLLVWLMVILEALHIFWLMLILRMIWNAVAAKRQVKQDIRSDEEDENDWAENRDDGRAKRGDTAVKKTKKD